MERAVGAHFRCGHPVVGNAIVRANGSKICRECKRARNRRWSKRSRMLRPGSKSPGHPGTA